MAKQTVVDQEKCIGCGTCAAIASESFKINDQGKAEAIKPALDETETIQRAIDACPVAAIKWEE